MNRCRRTLVKCGVTAALSALAAWAVLAGHGYDPAAAPVERYRLLCDAFFVPGVLLVCVGSLIFVSNFGLFNGISYAARYVARMFVPWSGKRDESYGDYVRRKGEGGSVTGYAFLFYVGAAFLAVSLVFLLLFYRAFNG